VEQRDQLDDYHRIVSAVVDPGGAGLSAVFVSE
jgi:hypothetical protein